MRQGQQRSRCDRAGGTPPPSSLAASPLVSENSPVKTPCLPRFFSHLYSQCLLSFCIMPPHPPLPPSSSPSCPSFLTSLPSPLLPLLLSFCVSHHPALLHLHRGAAQAIRTLHTYTHARADLHEHTHTNRHARTYVTHAQGDTRPQLPVAPLHSPSLFYTLTPLHCRHETFYNRWCASSSSRDTVNTAANQHSAFTHTHTLAVCAVKGIDVPCLQIDD